MSSLEARQRGGFDPSTLRRELAEGRGRATDRLRRGEEFSSQHAEEVAERRRQTPRKAQEEPFDDRGLKQNGDGKKGEAPTSRVPTEKVPEALFFLQKDLRQREAEMTEKFAIREYFMLRGTDKEIEPPKGVDVEKIDQNLLSEQIDSIEKDIEILEAKIEEYQALLKKGLAPEKLASVSQKERDKLTRSVGGIVFNREQSKSFNKRENVSSKVSSTSAHIWPPRGVQLKEGVIQHWPSVTGEMGFSREDHRQRIDKVHSLTRLGFGVKEAHGMSAEKASFIIENKITKEEWPQRELEYRELVDSGSFASQEKGILETRGNTLEEKSISTEDRERLEQLGYSTNQIDWVIGDEDRAFILKHNTKPEEWLLRSRARARGEEIVEEEDKVNSPLNKEQVSSEDREKLHNLGYSENQIDWVYDARDFRYILKHNLTPADWLVKKREFNMRGRQPSVVSEAAPLSQEAVPGHVRLPELSIQVPPGHEARIENRVLSDEEIAGLMKQEGPQEGEELSVRKEKLQTIISQYENVQGEASRAVLAAFRSELAEIEDYEKNKSELEKLGWSFEDYRSLSEDERRFIFWQAIRKEDYHGKPSEASESETITNRIAIINEGGPEMVAAVPPPFRPEGGPPPFTPSAAEGVKQEDLKGVSPGAKAFLKEERGRVELTTGLEKGYENFDKQKLIEIAKSRALPSGGDKSVLIERIVKNDIDTKRESFGFISDARIGAKLSELHISEKEMAFISPEFFSLSPDKQRYLLSKIEQKVYMNAEFASRDKNEADIATMSFWKSPLKTIGAKLFKGQRQVALREKMIRDIKNGGVIEYRNDIKTLSDYLSEAPELTYMKDERGKLVPYFEYVDPASKNERYETPKIFFNRAASRLGEIPYEWSLDSATSSQREAHRRATESYTLAKEALARAMREENPGQTDADKQKQHREIVAYIGRVNAQINFGRYITQNPDMENKTKLFFERTLGGRVDERLKFFGAAALGYGSKWFGRSMAVTGVGLGIAAAAGGAMSVYTKNKEFGEKELRKRYGKEVAELGVKKYVDSKKLYERLESMLTQLEKGKTSGGVTSDTARTLERIKTRIFVNESLLRDGRINFGQPNEQVTNQFKLSELMSRAAVVVEMNNGFATEKTEEEELFARFKQFIGDDRALSAKRKQVALAALKGAAIGAGGFLAGRAVREGVDYIKETGIIGAAWDSLKHANANSFEWAKNMLFRDDTGVAQTVLESPTGTSLVEETPSTLEQAMAGSRGVIGTIDDLQDKLRARFGTSIPPQYQEFLSAKPDTLAREWGFYKPGELDESAVIKKGEGFSIDEKGVVRLESLHGPQIVYVPEGVAASVDDYERSFFDSANSERSGSVTAGVRPEDVQVEQKPSFDFEAERRANLSQGFSDRENGFGTAFTREDVVAPVEEPARVVEGYKNIDGLRVNSKEMSGVVDFIYDKNGEITKMDLGALRVEDISRFRANPERFINEAVGPDEKTALAKKLLTVRSEVETYLRYQRILELKELHGDSKEYRYLTSESNRLWTAIQKKVEGEFNPEYRGRAPNILASTAEEVRTPARPAVEPRAERAVEQRGTSIRETVRDNGARTINTREVGNMITDEETVMVGGKSYTVSFGTYPNGQEYVPLATTLDWKIESDAVRYDIAKKLLKPQFLNLTSMAGFDVRFDEIAVAKEMVDSGEFPKGSSKYAALLRFIEDRKASVIRKYGDIFQS